MHMHFFLFCRHNICRLKSIQKHSIPSLLAYIQWDLSPSKWIYEYSFSLTIAYFTLSFTAVDSVAWKWTLGCRCFIVFSANMTTMNISRMQRRQRSVRDSHNQYWNALTALIPYKIWFIWIHTSDCNVDLVLGIILNLKNCLYILLILLNSFSII